MIFPRNCKEEQCPKTFENFVVGMHGCVRVALLTIKPSEALENVRPFQDDDPHGIFFIWFFHPISYSLFTFFSQVMANEASGLDLAMVSVLYG